MKKLQRPTESTWYHCNYEESGKGVTHDRDINVNAVTAYYGSPLIEESNLSLNYGNRYGFIGRTVAESLLSWSALG